MKFAALIGAAVMLAVFVAGTYALSSWFMRDPRKTRNRNRKRS